MATIHMNRIPKGRTYDEGMKALKAKQSRLKNQVRQSQLQLRNAVVGGRPASVIDQRAKNIEVMKRALSKTMMAVHTLGSIR